MKPDLEALQASLREDTPEVFLEKLGPVRSAFSDIPGASDIRSAVNDARKAMRRDPDPAAAAAALQEAGAFWKRESHGANAPSSRFCRNWRPTKPRSATPSACAASRACRASRRSTSPSAPRTTGTCR